MFYRSPFHFIMFLTEVCEANTMPLLHIFVAYTFEIQRINFFSQQILWSFSSLFSSGDFSILSLTLKCLIPKYVYFNHQTNTLKLPDIIAKNYK